MHKKAPLTMAVLSLLSDWLSVVFAVSAAFWIRFGSGWFASPEGIPPFEKYLPGIVIVASGWSVLFGFLGLYDPRKGLNRTDEALLLLKGTLLGSLFTMSAGFLYRGVSYSRIFLFLAIPLAFVTLLFSRQAVRAFRTWIRRRGYDVQRVLLVGGGRLAREVMARIEGRPEFGYHLVGFAAADGIEPPEGAPLLGDTGDVARIARDEQIDKVFIALPHEMREKTVEVIRSCESLPLEVEIVPDLYGRFGERVRLSEMDGIPLLGVKGFPLESWNRFVKRSFDIAFSLVLLVALLPLLPLLAAAIRLDSPGPIFYAQTRIGRDGRVFRIYKFRTMVTGAESKTGPVFAGRDDSRCTRIGAFLRRTSLDELPQLWNVLTGRMALVGPRPERPYFVRRFEREIPRYFDRHRVKSGMTGWAQVHGLRGDTSVEERTRYDLFYVENWSLLLDLKILLLTFRHVMSHALESSSSQPAA